MNMQDHAAYITNLRVIELNSPRIRGVIAKWQEEKNTLSLSFYVDGQPTEEELEDYSATCGEIIASCSNALMEENYIRWDYPKPLPDQEFLAYSRF